MDFIQLCRKMLSFDTSPAHGTRELVLWLKSEAIKRNLFVDIQEETINNLEQANIIIRPIQDKPGREFLLQTHLDTEDPGLS